MRAQDGTVYHSVVTHSQHRHLNFRRHCLLAFSCAFDGRRFNFQQYIYISMSLSRKYIRWRVQRHVRTAVAITGTIVTYQLRVRSQRRFLVSAPHIARIARVRLLTNTYADWERYRAFERPPGIRNNIFHR